MLEERENVAQLKGPLLLDEWNGRSSRDVLLLNREKAALIAQKRKRPSGKILTHLCCKQNFALLAFVIFEIRVLLKCV
jgi:hypothetical protein